MKRLFLVFFLVMALVPSSAFAVEDDGVNAYELSYISGNNDTVGTSFETVGDLSAASNFLTTAATLEVSSSSTADATTGALTITIEGLDADYAQISEVVTLTGQTNAVTVKSFLRINKMSVTTVGTGGINAGDIYAHLSATTAGVPTTATAIYSMIQSGAGSSKIAVFSTPANKLSLIKGVYESASAAGAFRIKVKTGTGPFVTVDYTNIAAASISKPFGYFIPIPPKSDVVVEALATGGSGKASVNLELRIKNK